MNSALSVRVLGVGAVGPGFGDWPQAQALMQRQAAGDNTPLAATVVPSPQRLPATERRRAGTIIKVCIQVADEALAISGLDAATLPTVFSASEGDGKNCHELCEALAAPAADRLVSPTRFTNSVHNAAAGYWHIATQSMAESTSLCAHDASFAAGLMEAAVQVQASGQPVLLVVADQPYPEPLHATRPLSDAIGVALVLGPASTASGLGTLQLDWIDTSTAASVCPSAALEACRQALPTARALPLLQALARAEGSGLPASTVVLAAYEDLQLRAKVHAP